MIRPDVLPGPDFPVDVWESLEDPGATGSPGAAEDAPRWGGGRTGAPALANRSVSQAVTDAAWVVLCLAFAGLAALAFYALAMTIGGAS